MEGVKIIFASVYWTMVYALCSLYLLSIIVSFWKICRSSLVSEFVNEEQESNWISKFQQSNEKKRANSVGKKKCKIFTVFYKRSLIIHSAHSYIIPKVYLLLNSVLACCIFQDLSACFVLNVGTFIYFSLSPLRAKNCQSHCLNITSQGRGRVNITFYANRNTPIF